MSPPIWMFCFLNSGIHALMYTYYTLSALQIRVPQRVKRTLTIMQISQFLIGITFATLHLFVVYSIPVNTAYTVTNTISSAASAAVAAAPTGIATIFRKFSLRASGEPGMAERVDAPRFINKAGHLMNSTQETKWRSEYAFIPCIATEGEAFAIWLNVFYLAPLTGLFIRFFIRSYSSRGARGSKKHDHRRTLSQAATDAAREFDSLGKATENGRGDVANGATRRANGTHSTPRSANGYQNGIATPEAVPRQQKQSMSAPDPINSRTPEHLRASTIRRKASVEHNKLRSMYEEGASFGASNSHDFRSVNTKSNFLTPLLPETLVKSNKTKHLTTDTAGKSQQSVEDPKAVEELQKVAEIKVRTVREAVGGESARSPDDALFSSGSDRGLRRVPSLAEELAGHMDSDTTDEVEQEHSLGTSQELLPGHSSYAQVAAAVPDASLNDVVDDIPQHPMLSNDESAPSVESSFSHLTSVPSLTPDNSSVGIRAASPTPSPRAKSASPPKSKIPKPSTIRGRSPVKMVLTPVSRPTSAIVANLSSNENEGSKNDSRGRSMPKEENVH
jgi:hypothetical protein